MYFRKTIFWRNLLAAHKLPYHEEQEFCLITTHVLATLTNDLALTLSALSRNRYFLHQLGRSYPPLKPRDSGPGAHGVTLPGFRFINRQNALSYVI